LYAVLLPEKGMYLTTDPMAGNRLEPGEALPPIEREGQGGDRAQP
jgi:hypothetical protein